MLQLSLDASQPLRECLPGGAESHAYRPVLSQDCEEQDRDAFGEPRLY